MSRIGKGAKKRFSDLRPENMACLDWNENEDGGFEQELDGVRYRLSDVVVYHHLHNCPREPDAEGER